MKRCQNCGKYLEDNAIFCAFCGSQVGQEETGEHVKKIKRQGSANHLAIVSLIFAVIPSFLTRILCALIGTFSNLSIEDVASSPDFGWIYFVYLGTIILTLILSVIGTIKGSKNRGMWVGIVALVISIIWIVCEVYALVTIEGEFSTFMSTRLAEVVGVSA